MIELTQRIHQEPEAANAPEIRDFVRREGLAALTQKAVVLVEELFPRLSGIVWEESHDPEESVQWLVLRVTSAAPRAELTAAYRQYIQRWVRETPADKRHLVRLSYSNP